MALLSPPPNPTLSHLKPAFPTFPWVWQLLFYFKDKKINPYSSNAMISSREESEEVVWSHAFQFDKCIMQWWHHTTIFSMRQHAFWKYCLKSTFRYASMTFSLIHIYYTVKDGNSSQQGDQQIPWKPVYIKDWPQKHMSEFIKEVGLWITVRLVQVTALRCQVLAIHKTTMGGLKCICSCIMPVFTCRKENTYSVRTLHCLVWSTGVPLGLHNPSPPQRQRTIPTLHPACTR